MSILRYASAVAALTLAASACTPGNEQDNSQVTDIDGEQILLTSALDTVDTCDALLERLKNEAIERVGPYGFDHNNVGPLRPDGLVVEEAMESADFAAAQSNSTGSAEDASEVSGGDLDASGEFSETNNQEQGVDEADLVKTDGRRLVTVLGNKLQVIDVEATEPRLINTVRLPEEFHGGELFLNDDTALLMTSGWTDRPFMAESRATSDWYPGSPTGRIIEIDLEQGTITRTLEFEGGYLSAREVQGSIRIVMSAAESRFSFVYPSNPGAEDSAEQANRDLIESSTIDMWVPTYRITENGETVKEGSIVDCDRVHLPAEFAGFGSLVVLTVDIENGLTINDSLAVFTDGQTVYASTERLAVATPRWPEFNENGEPKGDDNYRTAIHTFDISEKDRTEYSASGSVRGFLLNQYSMSEHEGYLRVATTDGSPWDSRSSESFVTVLAEDGNELEKVGQVGDLGQGEQIFAVRFLGDQGYVVTFRQIDPLYTLNLEDPTNPTVEGELKIPGFSSYLHPYGDYLIGVGTDGNDQGQTQGAVVSLFDVSDPQNPTRVDKLPLGPSMADTNPENGEYSESYSPVSDDARAFTLWEDVAIVPVAWWSYSERADFFEENNGSSVVLVKIGPDGNLEKVGEVSHPKTRDCENGISYEDDIVEVEPGGGGLDPDDNDDGNSNDEGAPAPTTVPAEDGSDTGDAEADFTRPPPTTTVEEPETLDQPIRRPGCFTTQPRINRSIIIDNNLYTVSDRGVGVNDFQTLNTVTWIPFD